MSCQNCKRLEKLLWEADCDEERIRMENIDLLSSSHRSAREACELRARIADLERENFKLHVINRGRSSGWLAALRRWFLGWRAGK